MTAGPEKLNVNQLAQAVQLLTALERQLRASPDHASETDEQYGLLVPPEPLPDDLEYTERWRLWEDAQMRDGMNALTIREALRVLRELLERHERSRVAHRILNWYIGAPFLYEETLMARLPRLGLPISALMGALKIAKEVHAKQQRDDGSYYLEEHTYPVAYEVARYLALQGTDDKLLLEGTVLALLHDTLEDCEEQGIDRGAVHEAIRRAFGQALLAQVETLTKLPKSRFLHLAADDAKIRRQDEYFVRIRSAPYVVKLVKLLDRINNLLCVHKSPNKIPGYIEETRRLHMPLAVELDSVLAEEMGYVIERLEAKLEMWDLDREIELEREAQEQREQS